MSETVRAEVRRPGVSLSERLSALLGTVLSAVVLIFAAAAIGLFLASALGLIPCLTLEARFAETALPMAGAWLLGGLAALGYELEEPVPANVVSLPKPAK